MKLPKSKSEWDNANDYFKANINISSEITCINTEVENIQTIIYSYFKEHVGVSEKVTVVDEDNLFEKYGDFSRKRLKIILQTLKDKNDPSFLGEIKFISKLLRAKYSKVAYRLKNSVDHNEKISKNFWKYCKEVFETKDVKEPEFNEEQCYQFFSKILEKSSHKCDKFPSWMKMLDTPTQVFNSSTPTYQEITKIVRKMKSSASACPLDQISILTLQNCPYLRTVVHRIISYCWDNQTVPKVWKYGFTILIHKKGSTKEPGNFRPITLEPVISKILSSVIRNRIYSFVSKNNYIETNLQKGFWDGIPGTIEHTELLTYIINHSRRKQRDMVITLLDLKNAFGEVSHDLLRMTLKIHHVPEEIISLINEFYTDYHVSVGTKSFVTDPIAVERGVLQGDCLSPILFNLCFNTLLRTIDEERIRLIGYYFNECLTPRHWFQFADDTAVITSSSEDNQLLLHVFSKWCTWSGLIVRVEKCKTFGVRKTKTTSIQYKPYLKICNEMVPQVEINDRFKYLGKEFSYDMTTDFVEAELKEDMTSYLKTLDSLPLHPHHKVSVITKYIYSKLRWRLSIYSISET